MIYQNKAAEDDFWTILKAARNFVDALRTTGFRIVAPDGPDHQQERLRALFSALISEKDDWLTDDLIHKGAEEIGAYIGSMEPQQSARSCDTPYQSIRP